jgi:hypothetical protein
MINTNYIGRFKSSPWVINTALRFILEFLNKEIFDKLAVDIREQTFDIFNYDNTFIGYHDGYLSLGISIDFVNTTKVAQIAKNYMISYLTSSTSDEIIEGPEPVPPHLKARMAESERLYMEHIRSDPEVYEREKAKRRANWLKYARHFPK